MENNLSKKIVWPLLLFFVLVFSVANVAADTGCCALDTSGEICADVEGSECAQGESFEPNVLCSRSAFCEQGCCYNNGEGIFTGGVLESSCTFLGGGWDWSSDSCSNLPGSDLGCCILGETTIFQTSGQCNTDAALLGIVDAEWRRDIDEARCLIIPYLGDKGACVYNDNGCRFTSRDSCIQSGGSFVQDTLCTANELNTTCEPTEQTTCLSGLDEVYFVDSCENVANIYDSGRANDQSYWEDKISEENSCGADASNADSKSCGNCDKYRGSFCSPASEYNFQPNLGDNYCRDLSCEHEGQRYNNGESWCIYDGAVGIDDVVGSRHWQYSCNQGIVESFGCGDYRNQICVQSNTEEGGVVVRRSAECVNNDWRECHQINVDFSEDIEEAEEECENLVHCRFENAKIAWLFRVRACMPLYPGAFDLRDDDSQEDAEELCGVATQTCKTWGGRESSFNGKCLDPEYFGESMNEICRGLGDCGGEVNIAGEYVPNFIFSKKEKDEASRYEIGEMYIQQLSDYATPVPGQFAVSENYEEFLIQVGVPEEVANSLDVSKPTSLINRHLGTLHDLYFPAALPLAYSLYAARDRDVTWFSGSSRRKYRTYQCLPWQPPAGGDSCGECNGDPLKPCSKYRCDSLGAGCQLINTESGDDKDFLCVDQCPKKGVAPSITPDSDIASENIKYSDISSGGFTLRGKDSSCIDPYTKVQFGIATDSPSICKYDYEENEYDNMPEVFSNFYEFNHSISLSFIDPSHGQSQGEGWVEDQMLYIKCKNNCGHENSQFYTIDLCVNSGPDKMGPLIEKFVPESGSLVSFDKETINVSVITNELATCKWDLVEKEYSDMGNEFICEDELGFQSSPFGYLCFGEVPINNASNIFYVACADQPWFNETENEGERNIREYTYTLKKPDEKITVDWAVPDSAIRIGTDRRTVELKIKTSGGGDSHRCYYSMNEEGSSFRMLETGSRGIHTQFLELSPKLWEIFVTCRDDIGDTVEEKVSFEIIKDVSAPLVSRVWSDFGEIYVITSEDAECRYSMTSCLFNWENGTTMGNLQIHTISSDPGEDYYIKCMDDLGNSPWRCSIKLKAV